MNKTITSFKKITLLFAACLLFAITSFSQSLDWAFDIGASSSDGGYGITSDASRNIYVTGYFQGTAGFNSDSSLFDNLTIESGQGQATIYNLLGQPVKQFTIDNQQSTIDMNALTAGTYLLIIERKNGK